MAAEPELRDALRRSVEILAGEIGERNVFRYDRLRAAADYLEGEFAAAGHAPRLHGYEVRGRTCHNVEVEIEGADRHAEIVVVGAHYDSVLGCPGANDNGSGVAALLALARSFAGRATSRTLRLVAFVNEEPPFFLTRSMGSRVYARGCRDREEDVVAMLSLETIGCYSDEPRSQRYPFPFGFFYPRTGNFIGFVSNLSSRKLLREVTDRFRAHSSFPSIGAAVPGLIPGVGWSDHWSFWRMGYRAVMVTDTALYRYPSYHTPGDTPEKLDYGRMATVVAALSGVVADLAGGPTSPSTSRGY